MAGKIKSVTHPRVSLNILSDEDVRRIHTATLDVIQNIGVRFPSHRALDIWEAHGALVDRQTMVVRAPGHLIEEALKTAPPAYALAARDPSQDLMMDGDHVFVGTDGCGVQVIDIYTGERRRSCLQDVADIARVADDVEEVAFHWVQSRRRTARRDRAACTSCAPSGKTRPSTCRREHLFGARGSSLD